MGRSIILRAMRWENGVRRLRAQRLCPQFLQKLIPFFFSVRLLMGCTTVNQAWLSVTVHPAFCWEGNNLCRLCDISEKYFPQPLLSSNDIYPGIKAMVHPKRKILSSLTHVVWYLYYVRFVWNTQGEFLLLFFFFSF